MPLLRTVCRVSLLLLLSTTSFSAATYAQQKLKAPKPEPDEIYDEVGQPAVPIGGVEAYAQYLADNQRYPTAALQRGVQGTAPVTFVVEKSGVISSVAVAKPLDPELDAEAIRLIRAGPKWTPAQHRGAKVRQRVTVPVSFAIPADEAGSTAAAEQTRRPQHALGCHDGKARRARPARGRHRSLLCLDSGKPEIPGPGPPAQNRRPGDG